MSEAETPDAMSTMVPEEQLLQFARAGQTDQILDLLKRKVSGEISLNINVKGQQKSNSGWSALHLASYFGHAAIVELLLNHGADINILNDTGDTPLHKASYTGRKEIVLLLLSNNANVFIKNGEGQTAWDVSKTKEICHLLRGAEKADLKKKNDMLLHAAREGSVNVIKELLTDNNPPDINYTDLSGNTALHCAAYRGKQEVAVLLLQNGIDPSIKNNRGQEAIDMAVNPKIKQILSVPPMKYLQKIAPRFEGSLLRKSRFIGWKQTWTVLEKGVISFFRSRADATTGSSRKGYKYLDGGEVVVDKNDRSSFVIKFNNGTRQRYCVPVSPHQQLDRQKWVNAVTEHIAFSTHYLNQGTVESDDNDEETDMIPLGTMQDKLKTALAHQQLLEKQVESCESFIKCMNNESLTQTSSQAQKDLPQQLDNLIEISRKVSSSLSHCLTVFEQQEELRLLQFKQQQEQIRVLQDAFHALAQEHHELEKSFVSPYHSPPRSPPYADTDCDEYFDTFEQDYSPPVGRPLSHTSDIHPVESPDDTESMFFASFSSGTASIVEPVRNPPARTKWGRAVLPVTMFSRNNFSLWSILKQCIGRELSKITMPVVFNEPLSFLQRVCENIEYYYLLEQANNCDDPVKRIEYVAAFAVASLSSNYERLAKPFNPLLGETFELDRKDEGFHLISEQVSHHPPVSAFHVHSENFTFFGAIQPKLKLWARSVEAIPEGTLTLHLPKHKEVYTWSGMKCCIHNIIVGKLWMEQAGVMQVTCHTSGLSASINYKPAGWFQEDINIIEGFISDSQQVRQRFLFGKWCSYLRSSEVQYYEDYLNLREKNAKSTINHQAKSSHNLGNTSSYISLEESELNGTASYVLNHIPSDLLWEVEPRPEYSSEYYNFTSFAMALNELTEDMEQTLPRTDSRFRPDIRRLEDGDIDGAAQEKNRLEEKQRETRKRMKKEGTEWVPLWFQPVQHAYTKEATWIFKGNYWNKDFSNSPDIF